MNSDVLRALCSALDMNELLPEFGAKEVMHTLCNINLGDSQQMMLVARNFNPVRKDWWDAVSAPLYYDATITNRTPSHAVWMESVLGRYEYLSRGQCMWRKAFMARSFSVRDAMIPSKAFSIEMNDYWHRCWATAYMQDEIFEHTRSGRRCVTDERTPKGGEGELFVEWRGVVFSLVTGLEVHRIGGD